MLDTNIVSHLIRHPDGAVARRLEGFAADAVGISIIVASELRFGALRRGSAPLSNAVDDLLDSIAILPLEDKVSRLYAAIRFDLERAGTPIGQNDVFIAAHALSLGAVLATDNIGEFSRVRGLTIENWLRP